MKVYFALFLGLFLVSNQGIAKKSKEAPPAKDAAAAEACINSTGQGALVDPALENNLKEISAKAGKGRKASSSKRSLAPLSCSDIGLNAVVDTIWENRMSHIANTRKEHIRAVAVGMENSRQDPNVKYVTVVAGNGPGDMKGYRATLNVDRSGSKITCSVAEVEGWNLMVNGGSVDPL